MISVNVTFIDQKIQQIEISGHANFDRHGKDIVCAGVSAIVYGSINAIDQVKKNQIEFKIKEGYTFIKVKKDSSNLQLLLKMMLVQLQTLEETYGQFIKINQLMEV
ncbi:putative uncharacterized protein [Firmicutes bacterium CAG:631]|nr:putative uncharacterized protein [Firmicutes bacterium CAG:631]